MADAPRSIFRAEAVRRYAAGQEAAVLPRCVRPRIFAYLWALLGLLAAGSTLAWLAQAPVYLSGPAIVVAPGKGERPALAVFLPPPARGHVRIGQQVVVQFDSQTQGSRAVVAVATSVQSPAAWQRRFALAPGAAQAVTAPAIVALAPLGYPPGGLPAGVYLGAVYHADVVVGSQRLIALVPVIGALFGG